MLPGDRNENNRLVGIEKCGRRDWLRWRTENVWLQVQAVRYWSETGLDDALPTNDRKLEP